jgi:hypothetical protein
MPSFSLNTGGSTSQSGQNFNGFDSYAMGTRQATTSIAATLRGQSTVGARNILMVHSMGLRVGGGTYDPGTGASTRPFIGCWRIWNSTAPTSAGASASSLSASTQFTLAASGNISTTKTLHTVNMSNVILSGGVTYLFGFNNATTGTAIWAGVSRVPVSTQNVYQDTLSSTPNDDPFVLRTTLNVNPGVFDDAASMMGTINYFTIPPAPVITSVTSLSNGARINFTVSETDSSTTTGCKAYFSLNNVSFTEVIGTFAGSAGSYTFTITSASLTLGQSYYFKVCALNAVTTLDNTNNPTYDTRSLDSNAIQQMYGGANFVKVRNSTNTAWVNASITVRTLIGGTLQWSGAAVKKRSSTNTWLNSNVSGSIYVFENTANPGLSYIVEAELTGDTETAYLWSRVSGASVSFTSTTAKIVTVTGPSAITTTVIQCIISYNGGSFTATTTLQWGLV